MLSAVTQDAPEPRDAAPKAALKAAGPVMPGMPNLHSHAFRRAMAGRAVQLELSQITEMEERAPYAYDKTLA